MLSHDSNTSSIIASGGTERTPDASNQSCGRSAPRPRSNTDDELHTDQQTAFSQILHRLRRLTGTVRTRHNTLSRGTILPLFAEPQLQKWWAARSEDQRATLKQAALKTTLEQDTVTLLFNTQCPVGPVGTKWETQPDWDWTWPGNVREFINAQ